MKKYILYSLVLLIVISLIAGCGTDYMLSSFYLRKKDLEWLVSPSEQASVNTRYRLTTSPSFKYSSPSIIATPANYILAIYEHRNKDNMNIIGVDGNDIVEVYVSISTDAEGFDVLDKVVGNYSINSYGSPISFLDENGNVVVLAVSGMGFAQGNANELTPIAVSISTNNGQSWTDWADIDTNVFKSLSDKGYNRYYTNPGNGKTLKNGTLACIIDYRKSSGSGRNNPDGFAIFYSTNGGKDWQVGATMNYTTSHRFARIITERTDGSLLIAAVPNTADDYNAQGDLKWFKADSINGTISQVNDITGLPKSSGGTISADNCTFVHNGYKKSGILLAHTFPNRGFTNANKVEYDITNGAAISLSEDEGKTWTLITNIVGTGPQDVAAFRQSLMVLKDGTIANFYEESSGPGINNKQKLYLVYRRFSLENISSGIYKYE